MILPSGKTNIQCLKNLPETNLPYQEAPMRFPTATTAFIFAVVSSSFSAGIFSYNDDKTEFSVILPTSIQIMDYDTQDKELKV